MIVDRVLFELEKQGMTVTELADRSKMQRTTLSRWLNGHTSMKTENLDKVLAVLGMSVESKRRRKRPH